MNYSAPGFACCDSECDRHENAEPLNLSSFALMRHIQAIIASKV
jgi:hypothetical protein